jgi:hypothetical protein
MTAALGHFNPYLQKLRALRAREGTAHRYNRRDPESHRIHQAGAWPVGDSLGDFDPPFGGRAA